MTRTISRSISNTISNSNLDTGHGTTNQTNSPTSTPTIDVPTHPTSRLTELECRSSTLDRAPCERVSRRACRSTTERRPLLGFLNLFGKPASKPAKEVRESATRKKAARCNRRFQNIERLESRLAMASMPLWQNPDLASDVDADGMTTPLDTLLVLNALETDLLRSSTPIFPVSEPLATATPLTTDHLASFWNGVFSGATGGATGTFGDDTDGSLPLDNTTNELAGELSDFASGVTSGVANSVTFLDVDGDAQLTFDDYYNALKSLLASPSILASDAPVQGTIATSSPTGGDVGEAPRSVDERTVGTTLGDVGVYLSLIDDSPPTPTDDQWLDDLIEWLDNNPAPGSTTGESPSLDDGVDDNVEGGAAAPSAGNQSYAPDGEVSVSMNLSPADGLVKRQPGVPSSFPLPTDVPRDVAKGGKTTEETSGDVTLTVNPECFSLPAVAGPNSFTKYVGADGLMKDGKPFFTMLNDPANEGMLLGHPLENLSLKLRGRHYDEATDFAMPLASDEFGYDNTHYVWYEIVGIRSYKQYDLIPAASHVNVTSVAQAKTVNETISHRKGWTVTGSVGAEEAKTVAAKAELIEATIGSKFSGAASVARTTETTETETKSLDISAPACSVVSSYDVSQVVELQIDYIRFRDVPFGSFNGYQMERGRMTATSRTPLSQQSQMLTLDMIKSFSPEQLKKLGPTPDIQPPR